MQEIELLVSTENGSIETNIEGLKKHIAAGLEEYKHMVFTEETKKEAKATVANLRKLKKNVNDRKIEVKKRYMAPYEEFETQAKELISLIDEPIDYIDSQIKAFEQKRIEERKALITDTYNGIMQEQGLSSKVCKFFFYTSLRSLVRYRVLTEIPVMVETCL